jgi:hypothetical protein
MRLFKIFLFIFISFLFASCKNNSSASQSEEIAMLIETPLFKNEPIVLDDSVAYYSKICNKPSFQFLIPVDINNDSFQDFIAHFWCDSNTPTQISYENVQDILIAYLSDGFGNYVVDNLTVFGELYPKLGGASRKYSRGDINKDGRDDFAFAMNAEDGRAAYDNETILTNYAYPAVLLSSDSGYEIFNIGFKDWGHSVQIKNDEVLFGGHNSQAYKFSNSSWIDISENYDELSFASFLVFDEFIINSVRKNSKQGLELVKENKIISAVLKEEVFKVYFESWNNAGTGKYEQLGVYEYKGKYFFHGMTSEMCRKDDVIVATINASIPIDREIIENEYYSQNETTPIIFFTFYKIENETLKEEDILITGEKINHNFNFFDCFDINQDNKKDIVAHVFSQSWNNESQNNKGVPEVYINLNNEEYYNLNTSNWPIYSADDDTQGYLHDIDNNGTQDLVMYPLKANHSAIVEIYLSNRNLSE